jgi:hypothetical protein
MRKILNLLLIFVLIFGITACSQNLSDENTETTIPEQIEEYTLVFSNEGMSLDLSWERLNSVIRGQHKNPDMMSEAIKQNQQYSATLIKLEIVVYNLDDTKAKGIKTALTPNISILDDTDITVCTSKPAAGQVTYIGDKYPAERLHQMLRLGFENYGIQIRGIYKYGYGDNQSEGTFKLSGKVKFEDQTDATQLHTGKLTLTETGAKLCIQYNDILEEFGLTGDYNHTQETVSTLGVMLFTSKRETCIGTMEIAQMTCSPDTRPEEWLLNLQYDHAQLNNDALLAEHAAVQQEVYAELTLIFETEEQEHMCTFFIRCDMSKNLS